MIRVSHVAAYPMNFNLLCDHGQQEEVLKLMKNDLVLVFLPACAIFFKFLGRWKSEFY